MKAHIKAIEYHLPGRAVTNADLQAAHPDWEAEKVAAKTGIVSRHIAEPDECASDLAVQAARRLFASGACAPADIDFLLLCTESADHVLPSTACLVQDRLGLSKECGAYDFNLGCSGFVYGLGQAKGLIETGQARRVLLLTADTYSKFMREDDRSVRTIFGDAAAATLVEAVDSTDDFLGPFIYGTDGSGGGNLIVREGGARAGWTGRPTLHMNGTEIFNFTLRTIPACIQRLHERSGVGPEAVDLYVFHQANAFMLEHLRMKLGIPRERFPVAMDDCGNTVSSSIPVALKKAQQAGALRAGMQLMLVGFGVGYSWGATLVRWQG